MLSLAPAQNRGGILSIARGGRGRGLPFRTFVHPSERMGAALEAAGLVRVARQGTLVWVLDLYRRQEIV